MSDGRKPRFDDESSSFPGAADGDDGANQHVEMREFEVASTPLGSTNMTRPVQQRPQHADPSTSVVSFGRVAANLPTPPGSVTVQQTALGLQLIQSSVPSVQANSAAAALTSSTSQPPSATSRTRSLAARRRLESSLTVDLGSVAKAAGASSSGALPPSANRRESTRPVQSFQSPDTSFAAVAPLPPPLIPTAASSSTTTPPTSKVNRVGGQTVTIEIREEGRLPSQPPAEPTSALLKHPENSQVRAERRLRRVAVHDEFAEPSSTSAAPLSTMGQVEQRPKDSPLGPLDDGDEGTERSASVVFGASANGRAPSSVLGESTVATENNKSFSSPTPTTLSASTPQGAQHHQDSVIQRATKIRGVRLAYLFIIMAVLSLVCLGLFFFLMENQLNKTLTENGLITTRMMAITLRDRAADFMRLAANADRTLELAEQAVVEEFGEAARAPFTSNGGGLTFGPAGGVGNNSSFAPAPPMTESPDERAVTNFLDNAMSNVSFIVRQLILCGDASVMGMDYYMVYNATTGKRLKGQVYACPEKANGNYVFRNISASNLPQHLSIDDIRGQVVINQTRTSVLSFVPKYDDKWHNPDISLPTTIGSSEWNKEKMGKQFFSTRTKESPTSTGESAWDVSHMVGAVLLKDIKSFTDGKKQSEFLVLVHTLSEQYDTYSQDQPTPRGLLALDRLQTRCDFGYKHTWHVVLDLNNTVIPYSHDMPEPKIDHNMRKFGLPEAATMCVVLCVTDSSDHGGEVPARCNLTNPYQASFIMVVTTRLDWISDFIVEVMYVIYICGVILILFICGWLHVTIAMPANYLHHKIAASVTNTKWKKTRWQKIKYSATQSLWVGDMKALISTFNIMATFYYMNRKYVPEHVLNRQVMELQETDSIESLLSNQSIVMDDEGGAGGGSGSPGSLGGSPASGTVGGGGGGGLRSPHDAGSSGGMASTSAPGGGAGYHEAAGGGMGSAAASLGGEGGIPLSGGSGAPGGFDGLGSNDKMDASFANLDFIYGSSIGSLGLLPGDHITPFTAARLVRENIRIPSTLRRGAGHDSRAARRHRQTGPLASYYDEMSDIPEATILALHLDLVEDAYKLDFPGAERQHKQIYGAINGIIRKFKGEVFHRSGDTFGVAWNAFETRPDHVLRGTNCALELASFFEELREHGMMMGLAVHKGPIVSGVLTDDSTISNVVFGRAVDVALHIARLGAKLPYFSVMLTEPVKQAVSIFYVCIIVDVIKMENEDSPITVFEVRGTNESHCTPLDVQGRAARRHSTKLQVAQSAARNEIDDYVLEYTQAFAHFRAHHFSQALAHLQRLYERYGMDTVIERLIKLCSYYTVHPGLPKPYCREMPKWILFEDAAQHCVLQEVPNSTEATAMTVTATSGTILNLTNLPTMIVPRVGTGSSVGGSGSTVATRLPATPHFTRAGSATVAQEASEASFKRDLRAAARLRTPMSSSTISANPNSATTPGVLQGNSAFEVASARDGSSSAFDSPRARTHQRAPSESFVSSETSPTPDPNRQQQQQQQQQQQHSDHNSHRPSSTSNSASNANGGHTNPRTQSPTGAQSASSPSVGDSTSMTAVPHGGRDVSSRSVATVSPAAMSVSVGVGGVAGVGSGVATVAAGDSGGTCGTHSGGGLGANATSISGGGIGSGDGGQAGGGVAASSIIKSYSFHSVANSINMSINMNPAQFEASQLPIEMTSNFGVKYIRSSNVLGRGSYGCVYMGMEQHTGKLVAIKFLPLPREESELEKIENEVKIMSTIHDQFLVDFFGYAILDGKIALFQECMVAGTLAAMLQNFSQLPPQTAVNFIRDVLKGLRKLHSNDIVHRDIKPQNSLLTTSGHCKISDFGASATISMIARQQGSEQGVIQGTPLYLAPEGARAQPCTKSDIWSVGIMSIQLLTGELPYDITPQLKSNPALFVFQIASGALRPKIPPQEKVGAVTHAFLMACLACNVEDRKSADELLQMPFFSV